MTGSASENWPVSINITRVPLNILGEQTQLFLLVGTMNKLQLDTLVKDGRVPVELVSTIAAGDSCALSAVLTFNQLKQVYEALEGPSKSWRGQYYSVTQAFVAAYRAVTT